MAEQPTYRWLKLVTECSGPADAIRDQLADLLQADDALVVIGAGSEAAWAGLESTASDWLAEHLPR